MLTIKNIETWYDLIRALHGISFEIRQGDIVALLGSNGAGKTTTLKTIMRLLDDDQPEKGTIEFMGRRIDRLDTEEIVRLGISYVPEGREVFPELSVMENILMGAYTRRDKKGIRDDIESMLKLFPILGKRKDQQAGHLSGGEQQMLAIARALMSRPKLLMLDEPLGALDHTLRTQLIQELRAMLRQSQIPVIYVTHDREEAFGLADRLLILHEGVILQQGTPQELFKQPASPWVAEFLGLGNLVPGVVSQTEPLTVKTAFAELSVPTQRQTLAAGQECMVLLRPEDALLSSAATPERDAFGGVVRDSRFMGEYHQLELLCDCVSLLSSSQEPAQIGARLQARWSPESIQVFPNS